MKKTIAFSIVILICLVSFTGCSQSNSKYNGSIDQVYSLSGGNDFIEVKNGMLIKTDKSQMFYGGDLTFKGDEPLDMKIYTTKYYFYLDGFENSFNLSTAGVDGSDKGIGISTDLSTTIADLMFSNQVWDIITEEGQLHFSFSGTFMNGEDFEHSIIINVKQVF